MNNGPSIAEAIRVLRRGGVIAFPTETSYGLGCDPRNVKAIRRIYAIKGREKKKSLPLVAASIAQAGRVADLSRLPSRLRRLWPGPVTFVLPRKNGKSDVAIRVSSSPIVRQLCRAFGHPIIATSANRSGANPAFSAIGVCRAFHHARIKPDLILDGGRIARRKPSTIARVRRDGSIEVLRQGTIRL